MSLAEERQHRARWDRDTFGPPAQQNLPDNVDRLFEAAWVALERERVTLMHSLPGAQADADEAEDRLTHAKSEASRAENAAANVRDKLHKLVEQQKGMAGS